MTAGAIQPTMPEATPPALPCQAEQAKRLASKKAALRGKSFRSLKMIAALLEATEKLGDVAQVTDEIPVLGLIAWSLVALCDILRYHFQRMHQKSKKIAETESMKTQYDFGHTKAVRFRAIKCILSCLKMLVHLVATVLSFTVPGAAVIFKPISTALSAASSTYTLSDDSHKFSHKVKHRFLVGITGPFHRAGLLIKKSCHGELSDAEHREISAFTGKAVFTAIGLIGACLTIAAFAMGPAAPIGLAILGAVISAIGVIGYSTCSITKAAFDLEAEKLKQKNNPRKVTPRHSILKPRSCSGSLKRPRDPQTDQSVRRRSKSRSVGERQMVPTS
jgi:hypothetical protein